MASPSRISPCRLGAAAGYALLSAVVGDACAVFSSATEASRPRLTARPRRDTKTSVESGGPLPLLVFLHGATQNGAGMLRRIGPAADSAGVAVLAPDSRGVTWDAIRGRFGEDVAFLDRALEHVFARVSVDPARIAVGGFSDGASYALSLGLANGDLFPRVVAFSPGFVIPAAPNGQPRFFISHGTADRILPIDQCSRRIVPRLRALGHDVTFREFDGRHEVPPAVADEGLQWMAAH